MWVCCLCYVDSSSIVSTLVVMSTVVCLTAVMCSYTTHCPTITQVLPLTAAARSHVYTVICSNEYTITAVIPDCTNYGIVHYTIPSSSRFFSTLHISTGTGHSLFPLPTGPADRRTAGHIADNSTSALKHSLWVAVNTHWPPWDCPRPAVKMAQLYQHASASTAAADSPLPIIHVQWWAHSMCPIMERCKILQYNIVYSEGGRSIKQQMKKRADQGLKAMSLAEATPVHSDKLCNAGAHWLLWPSQRMFQSKYCTNYKPNQYPAYYLEMLALMEKSTISSSSTGAFFSY